MNLWLPNGMNMKAYRVDRAVNAYDERLMFARNEDTGDWCVFIRMPNSNPPFPVIGFGSEVPEVEDVMYRVQVSDTMRAGNTIYNEVVESQKKYKEAFKVSADEAIDESSEVVEHFMRKHGKSPIIKSFSKEVSNNDA